ncbi:MAG: radical SAM protein [Planctomycetota bacterium]|jgi:hypothetical protein
MNTIPQLSIVATTRCNLNCPLCMIQWLMNARPREDLSLEQLGHFIRRCEQLEVFFPWAWFTGGEPTLWPHLEEGIRMLAASRSFGKLRINTNGAKVERLLPVIDLLANVRFSVYHTNADRARELFPQRQRYKLGFWSEPHRAAPEAPIEGGLPAPCICPIASYFDGRLYACPGGYSVAAKLGLPLDDPRFSCDVDDDFVSFYREHERSRLNQDICRSCLSNGVVYQQQEPTQETPVRLEEIQMMRGRSKA